MEYEDKCLFCHKKIKLEHNPNEIVIGICKKCMEEYVKKQVKKESLLWNYKVK